LNVWQKKQYRLSTDKWLGLSMLLLGTLKLYSRYNILISRTLWYLAMMWSFWCRVSRLLLYCVKCHSLWDHVTNCTILGVWCIFFPPAVNAYITFYVYWLQLYMCAEVEITSFKVTVCDLQSLQLKSGICVNNMYFIMYHILKQVLEMTCSNCQMQVTPGEQTC
jgi:hypothetical protein